MPDRRFVDFRDDNDDEFDRVDPRIKLDNAHKRSKRSREKHPDKEKSRHATWRNKSKNKQKLAEKARLRRAQKWIKKGVGGENK